MNRHGRTMISRAAGLLGRASSLAAAQGRAACAVLAVLVTMVVVVPPSAAAASITVTSPPSGGVRVPEGDDFATAALGDAWDMSEATDFAGVIGFSGVNVAGGVWSGRVTHGPALTLLDPGVYATVHWKPKNGVESPIDADTYSILSFKMYVDRATPPYSAGKLIWYFGPNTDDRNICATSNFFPVQTGWHVYTLNLKTLGAQTLPSQHQCSGGRPWAGTVKGLRFDPTGETGALVALDWIRLTNPGKAVTPSTVTWTSSGLPGGSTVDVLYDDDQNISNGSLGTIAAGIQASLSAAQWDTKLLGPGGYYVHVRSGSVVGTSTGRLTVNAAPLISITDPSYDTGDDFATTVVGNAWDMSQSSDATIFGFTNPSFAGGVFTGTTTTLDNAMALRTDQKVIDTRKYRYVTYRFNVASGFDADPGWTSRFLWFNQGEAVDLCTTRPILVQPGWTTYTFDLGTAEVEPPVPPPQNNPCSGTPWLQATPKFLRFDPHEVAGNRTIQLDFIRLSGAPTADTSMTIRWQEMPSDGTPAATVDLYYYVPTDTQQPFKPIGSRIPASNGSYNWDTRQVPAGSYLILASISDGLNATQRFSEVPVTVSHGGQPPPPPPGGSVMPSNRTTQTTPTSPPAPSPVRRR